MQTEVFRGHQAFDILNKEWWGLLSRSTANSFFLSPLFQETWWKHFGREGLSIVTLRDQNQKLVALAPFILQSKNLTLIGGEEIADYLDVVVQQEDFEINSRRLWETIENLGWQTIRLLPLPGSSPSLNFLPVLAKEKNWMVIKKIKNSVFSLKLPTTWEEHLKSLDRKDRHEIRRKIKRIEAEGKVEFYKTEIRQKLNTDLDTFFKLHRQSRKDKADFMDPKMESFFRDLADKLFSEGLLSLSFLILNDQPVATEFSIYWQRNLLIYNSGYDRSFAALSPGLVLAGHLIRESIEKGLSKFDFMQGPERYKKDLGGKEEYVYALEISR